MQASKQMGFTMTTTQATIPARAAVSNPQSESDLRFRISVVVEHLPAQRESAVFAIQSAVSNSVLISLIILSDDVNTSSTFAAGQRKSAYKWLEAHRLVTSNVTVLRGTKGFEQMLRSDVHAVYLVLPKQQQSQYVVSCLTAGKHVLLNDPESTSLEDFTNQMKLARQNNRVVQFSTMFVHHHRVKEFLDCVETNIDNSVEEIHAILSVNHSDLAKVGVSLPLTPGDGCIRRLGRYCVLISSLLLTRLFGSSQMSEKIIRAQVTQCEYDDSGRIPISADCIVHWSHGRRLQFHVSYDAYAPTRQVLTVRSKHRYATMTDFCIPHPDGLATYRVYDKLPNPFNKDKLEVVKGEALDVFSGPPQTTMMWRRFAHLCSVVDTHGWSGVVSAAALDNSSNHSLEAEQDSARELATVALQTKRILMALDDDTTKLLRGI